ncbi:MAG: ABC transporter permease subunit [Ignavibacteriales bacterium]|jgi:ABC-2 type transport system permease protein|nr:ABC transporter permease subunit [Ignavibacteriales bacterium]MBK7265220.1 ABC transporter permease subunit [Ignavibacteriales bacterium]MBK8661684.1 ABC transporter permease subunit [Ignavibacteriales bacterium]MBP9122175.1 ABC transporter permease subunit [Ignavibacteriaceae bacterium]MCC6638059.1 ABC transporter permease subunit [Ignavibacteriaceae bacterium]
MIDLVRIELYKIFKKWRTYIGFLAIAVIVLVIEIALLVEGENYLRFLTRNLESIFVFEGNFLNGYLISFIVMGAIGIHIPFLITLVAGDLLAGEATAGTYRMLLTRPITRMQLLSAKVMAGTIYTILMVLFLAVVSLGLGVILFGTGELIVITDVLIIFAREDILWRFMIAYGIATLSMMVVTSMAFFFSSLVENAIGPIVSTMAVIIVFYILSAIDIELLQNIKPYLFTTYMQSWRVIFTTPVEMSELYQAVGVLSLHIVLFLSLTFYLFSKKDITS